MNEKNMFFIEHFGVIMSGCMLTILSVYVLQCNNIACAVIMVQVLAIIYSILWSVIMWKMMQVIVSNKAAVDVDLTEDEKELEHDLSDEYHENVFDLFHFDTLLSAGEFLDRWENDRVIHLKRRIAEYEEGKKRQ